MQGCREDAQEVKSGWIDDIKRLGALIDEANSHLANPGGPQESLGEAAKEPESSAEALSQALSSALDSMETLGRQIDRLRNKF